MADLHGANGTGWIGVDLDGTLAFYDGWKGALHIRLPIPRMLERVLGWLTSGQPIKIVTARVSPNKDDASQCRCAIEEWLKKHVYSKLPESSGSTYHIPITNEKDHLMIELWDDRCVQVVPNTGERADGKL